LVTYETAYGYAILSETANYAMLDAKIKMMLKRHLKLEFSFLIKWNLRLILKV
jgi:hypothetical protein